jgi:hypothetical protein
MKNLKKNSAMAEQSDLKKKWKDMVTHVTTPRRKLDGMAVCPFASMGFKRNEIDVVWVKKDMFVKADNILNDYPKDKQLVLCIGDPEDYTLEQLETWEKDNQAKAVEKDLYIYTSYKTKEKQQSAGYNSKVSDGPVGGFGSGNKGLAIIQIQVLSDLNEKSEWMHKNTKYYNKWDKKYYSSIVKQRYKDSKYNSEDFEKYIKNPPWNNNEDNN